MGSKGGKEGGREEGRKEGGRKGRRVGGRREEWREGRNWIEGGIDVGQQIMHRERNGERPERGGVGG